MRSAVIANRASPTPAAPKLRAMPIPRAHALLPLTAPLLAALALGCGDNLAAPPDATVSPTPDAPPPALRCSDADPPATLGALPGVLAVLEAPCGDYVEGATARCFQIDFDQPIDHAHPEGPHFPERLFLVHRGCDRPTVVADWGYENGLFFDDELARLFSANTLWLEHRFQGGSVPAAADWDWTQLTIENGAQDMHAVIAAFRPHYAGRWVSTGASKGGITATYHRYFFPDDVDGSIPYVAPASRARIDPAYQDRLTAALPDPCAQRVRDVQVASLTTRHAMMLGHMRELFGPGYDETYLQSYVSGFDWGFWQYAGFAACSGVPTAASTDDAFWTFFAQASGLAFAAGDAAAAPGPTLPELSGGALYYEWLTEQGFALQIGAHIAPLITDPYASATMEDLFRAQFPTVDLPAYDGAVTLATRAWARDAATRLLLVYGDYDPWSGGAMDAPTGASTARYFVPHANHGAAISGLDPVDEAAALALAAEMFGEAPSGAKPAAQRAAAQRDAILAAAMRRARGAALVRIVRARR